MSMFWRELGYLLPPTTVEDEPIIVDKKYLKRKRNVPNLRANEPVPVIPTPVDTFIENESTSEGQESGSSEYYEELSAFSPFQLLPNEVLIFIFKKLSVYDLCQTIPRVNKHWHSIADDNQLWKELYLCRWKTIPKRLQRIMAVTSPHTPTFSAPRWINSFDSCSVRFSTAQFQSDSSPNNSPSNQDSETEAAGKRIPPAKTHKETTPSWHLQEVCYHDSEDYSAGDDSGDEMTAGSDFLLLDPFITTRSESLSSESSLSLPENEEMFSAGSPTLSHMQEVAVLEDEDETDADLADDEAEEIRHQSRKKKYKKKSSEEEQQGFAQTYSSSPRAVLRAPSPSPDSSPSSSEIDETTDECPSDTCVSPVELGWRKQYLRRMEVVKNWQSVRYVLSTLKGHSLAVMCVKCSTPSSSSLLVEDEKDAGVIVSCSLDKSIKLWDLKQGKCLRTFTGHKDWVNYVDFQYLPATSSTSARSAFGEANRKRLVSCGYDASVRVWNAENGSCVRTLYGHQNIVWAAQMIGSMITSCSSDATVRVWDAEQGKCTRTMTGHRSVAYCMGVDPAQGKGGNVIVSGSMDKTIKVWDVRVGSAVITLSGHTERLCCLQYDAEQGLIVSGSRDSTVRLWELRKKAGGMWGSGENIGTLRGHQGRVCCLQFDEEKIVTGSDDNTVKVWSMEKARSSAENALVNTLVDHDCWVNSLWFDEERLVSGAADDTIKVWDFLDVSDKAKRSKRSRLRQDSVCLVS